MFEPRSITVEIIKWEKLEEECKKRSMIRSRLIRSWIDRQLKKWELENNTNVRR